MEVLHSALGSSHFREVQYLLTSGHPPVYLQLAVANMIVFALWFMRRVRGRHRQSGGGHIFALLLLAANIGIVMHGQMSV